MSPATTAALVGTTGGAGTTRTAVELAAALAADGQDVAVLDAAFATQGLSDYLSGRLDPDLTTLLLDEDVQPGKVAVDLDLPASVPGRVACYPVAAPFERLARAKSPDSARKFEALVEQTASEFDRVLIDTPPVAANQAIAAVTAVDRVALLTPATTRGRDAVQRMRARLLDLGVEPDAVITTRGELPDADATIPETATTAVADAPACLDRGPFATAVVDAAETVFACSLDVEAPGGLLSRVRKLR